MSRSAKTVTFRAIVDRIEGDIAVLELPDGVAMEIPSRFLPQGIGDGSAIRFRVDRDERAEARQRDEIADLQARLLGNR